MDEEKDRRKEKDSKDSKDRGKTSRTVRKGSRREADEARFEDAKRKKTKQTATPVAHRTNTTSLVSISFGALKATLLLKATETGVKHMVLLLVG